MRVCRDAVGIDQIPALGVTHSAFGYHLAVTYISGAHGPAFDVLHSFCDRFDLLFNMIQALLLANGIGGHCGDHLDFRQRLTSAEIAVNQFALYLPGQIVGKGFHQHQITGFDQYNS